MPKRKFSLELLDVEREEIEHNKEFQIKRRGNYLTFKKMRWAIKTFPVHWIIRAFGTMPLTKTVPEEHTIHVKIVNFSFQIGSPESSPSDRETFIIKVEPLFLELKACNFFQIHSPSPFFGSQQFNFRIDPNSSMYICRTSSHRPPPGCTAQFEFNLAYFMYEVQKTVTEATTFLKKFLHPPLVNLIFDLFLGRAKPQPILRV